MQDWIEIQISLIELEQAEFLQVFLPYIYDGKRTFFETIKANDYLLPEHKG